MSSYNTYEGWWKANILSLDENLFVRNPYPNKNKFDIDNIQCCNHKIVELKCGELEKIDVKRRELFEAESCRTCKTVSNNFCLGFKESKDKHGFLIEHVHLWNVLLKGDSSHQIIDTEETALHIRKLSFPGSRILLIRKIYHDRCVRGNKTYHHVQPPASPIFKSSEKDIYAEVEGYAKFFQQILLLKNKFEKHLSVIYQKTHFNVVNSKIEDYISFFSNYFTNEVQLAFQTAYEEVSKPPKSSKPLFNETVFHSEIFSKQLAKFKKQILIELGAAPDKYTRKNQVSILYSNLRKVLFRGKSHCRSLKERLFNEPAFATAQAMYMMLKDFIESFKEENCRDIDKHIAIHIDMPMFETILLKRFQKKGDLLRDAINNFIDENEVTISCNEMVADFSNEFIFSCDVFKQRWIDLNSYDNKKMMEEDFINETLTRIQEKYLSFEIENPTIILYNEEGDSFSFDIDFFQQYIVRVFLKIQSTLNQRKQKLNDLGNAFSQEIKLEPKKSSKVPSTKKELINSFLYKPDGMTVNQINKRLAELYDNLKNGDGKIKFIGAAVKKTELRSIMSDEIVSAPIHWLLSLSDLHYFIELIHKVHKVVNDIYPHHWYVGAKCFVDESKNPITQKQLHDNNDPPSESVVKLLNQYVKALIYTPPSLPKQ